MADNIVKALDTSPLHFLSRWAWLEPEQRSDKVYVA